MNLNEMWRQSDKSYIHPSDMHDKHIMNAIRLVTKKYVTYFGDKVDLTLYTEREWNMIRHNHPELKKLIDEGVRRGIIVIQPNEKPVHISPLASISAGEDITRCFFCNSCAVTIVREVKTRVRSGCYYGPPETMETVACVSCGTSITASNGVNLWKGMHLLRRF